MDELVSRHVVFTGWCICSREQSNCRWLSWCHGMWCLQSGVYVQGSSQTAHSWAGVIACDVYRVMSIFRGAVKFFSERTSDVVWCLQSIFSEIVMFPFEELVVCVCVKFLACIFRKAVKLLMAEWVSRHMMFTEWCTIQGTSLISSVRSSHWCVRWSKRGLRLS